MNISRRRFIETATVATGALLVLNGSGLGQLPDPPLPPIGGFDALSRMNFVTFFEQMNTDFMFLNKDRVEIPLKLIAVEDQRPLAQQKWGQGRENFMLRFSGPWKSPFLQDTYRVSHFALGQFELFITKGRIVEGDLHYAAIINRVAAF